MVKLNFFLVLVGAIVSYGIGSAFLTRTMSPLPIIFMKESPEYESVHKMTPHDRPDVDDPPGRRSGGDESLAHPNRPDPRF
jgi:hypothetical protein